MARGPVLIDLEAAEAAPSVSEAEPVPDRDIDAGPQGQAMQVAARLAARRPARLMRWFWGLLAALLTAMLSLALWDFVTGLLARAPVLGWAAAALVAALGLIAVVLALRELAAFGRLGRIDGLRRAADRALADRDLGAAQQVARDLLALYAGREETRWGRDRLSAHMAEAFDAEGLLMQAETDVLAALDAAATREIETAARQVATVTALVPMAFADVIAAFSANLTMIRRVADIYGGRSGVLGNLRLTRAVLSHLVATGAVAVGDDMIEHLVGGSIIGKLSRRFGEGVVNGALTARVGVAAIEVCRPLPFVQSTRPSVRAIVPRALAGLFGGATR
ncbi:MAG: TIGR01620 family protein [Rhodobacteraceae bacterium]|nr:TIGR01620 family protein [Paracoccaceae bacterium]